MATITEKFIVESPYKSLDFPKADVWTFLQKSFRKNGSNIALIDPKEHKAITFHNLETLTESLAVSLQEHGFRQQKSVVICMTNCTEFVFVLLAVWRLTGTVAVVNPLLSSAEIHKQLQMLDNELLFCNQDTTEKCINAAAGTSVKKIFSNKENKDCIPFVQLYKNIGKSPGEDIKPIKENELKERTAVIPFSSGTTGFPKGVQITHSGLVEQTTYFSHITGIELTHNGSINCLPFAHMYGLEILLATLGSGQKTIIMQGFDLHQYINLIAKYKIEILYIVPPMAVILCNSNIEREHDLSCVIIVICSAAPLSKDLEVRMKAIFGKGVKITQGLGLTETTCLAFCVPAFDTSISCPHGSVGWPLCNTQAKVIDLNTYMPVCQDTHGEICIKNNYFMKGYLNNQKATAEMIDKDGWLHTGDIGYYNKHGCFFTVDRLKELIKYKGYQVAPAELEAILLSHPQIIDAAVTWIPDTVAGELPHAWVVVRSESHLTESDIHRYIDGIVASYKRLRGGISFVQSIPKSPSGKILRRLLRKKTIIKSNL